MNLSIGILTLKYEITISKEHKTLEIKMIMALQN